MNWRRWLGRDRDAADPVSRCIVVDTETSGLDIDSDVLLAIGGVAVDPAGVVAGDSFEVVVRNAAGSSKENIEVHGIGRQAQAAGVPADEAMRAFAEWAGGAPGVAFHAPFDRAILARAARQAGVPLAERPWLDLAPLGAALYPPDPKKPPLGLDAWLDRFGIDCAGRHHAAGDALATAELYLRLRVEARREGARDFAGLLKLARQQRWLASSGGSS